MEENFCTCTRNENLPGQKGMKCNKCSGSVGDEASPCTGCGVRISDRYYLSAVGRRWHVTCLRCCACQKQLDPATTCYMNSSNIYCEFDFRRLFMSRDCAGCFGPIRAEDMVMQIRNAVSDKGGNHVIYHARCFTCFRCDNARPLSAGEHYGIQDGRVYCRTHYCELQMGLRQSAVLPIWPSVATTSTTTVGRRPGTRGRPRKMRPTIRPPEKPSPRFNTEPAETAVDTEPTDHCSERMSSDVSDDAIHDDANSSNGGGGNSNGAWDDSGTGSGSGRRKRMRSSFKHHQLKIMKSYFQTNHNPDAKELREIALKTGLMTRVIQVWFQNARAKFRRNLSKQHHQHQLLGYVADPMTSASAAAATEACPMQAGWAEAGDIERRHLPDRDFRYCRGYSADVIGGYDQPVTQCRDCCAVEMSYENSSELPHYQQLYH